MRYLKPLRPFFAWSQLSIPTVYDDSLSYYEVLNKCIFHFNEMLKIMQENYEIIDEAFAKILEECEAAIARCEEAAARAEAAQSAAEKAQAAAEAAQAAAEAAQKLAEAAQAAAEAARDDAVIAQKAAEAAQAAAEAAQAAAEAAQKKAETAQAAAEAAQEKAEDAQEKAESARDAAQASQTAAEAAQTAAESARDTAQAAQAAAESARDAAQAAQAAAESARDAALDAAEEIKKALDNYLPLSGGTMTGKINVQDEWNDTFTGLSKGNYVTTIIENSDLNDVKTNCLNFYTATVATSEESKNFPAKVSGFLVSLVQNPSIFIRQIYYTSLSNTIYTRVYRPVQNSWSTWEEIATTAEINNSLSGYLSLTGGTMTGKINVEDEWTDTFTGLSKGNYVTTINENSDLNNVKTNSINFYKTTIAMSEESKNFPAKVSGFLVSLSQYSSTYTRQIYYTTIYKDIYTRIYNSSNSSWSNWEKISFETDIVGNYLPLSGGTMTGNITMSADTKLIGNAETSDFFKLIQIPYSSDMNKIISSGFYAISSGDSVSNAPEEISAENNAFSCFVFPWQYPNTTGISQLIFSGDGTAVKGVYLRLTNNPDVGWGDWVRLDNVPDTNTVKVYQVKETDHLRFITYDLGNYYKVEGYTKQELQWKIPKTIESSPVVGNTYIYNTSTDDELTEGIGEQYTMKSDAHINVCSGLDYFRSNGIVSSISLGGKLSMLALDDSFSKFSFEIQIVWPDDETWNNMGNKYDILLYKNTLIGVVILPK